MSRPGHVAVTVWPSDVPLPPSSLRRTGGGSESPGSVGLTLRTDPERPTTSQSRVPSPESRSRSRSHSRDPRQSRQTGPHPVPSPSVRRPTLDVGERVWDRVRPWFPVGR